jgi:23S rRNA (cytosine1962-C5)-methyltransferase
MKNIDLIAKPWRDYELLDSGDDRKLERFGAHVIIRPETQALWKPRDAAQWKKAAAEFAWKEGKGSWKKKDIPDSWELGWNEVRFVVRLTSFKHTGMFPEQASNWEWIAERVKRLENPRVLNLFGYTGIASIVAAKHGAEVTHVDASKQSNLWAKENAERSGIPENSIRFLLEDALKFAEREARRGAHYDGIILDPPAFGRGAKGEVWKIEEDLPRLLDALSKILSKKPGAFFLLNGYAAGYSPQSFRQAAESAFGSREGDYGELGIAEGSSGRAVPSGVYVRFVIES